MSQAFVKEGDQSDDLPERPLPDRPNYVTPAGLSELRRRIDELTRRRAALAPAERARVERDLRYYEARLLSAVMVDLSKDSPDEVRFGARVELVSQGKTETVEIVGEDEADAPAGKLSWSSPMALALMGARTGDDVVIESGEGERRVTVLSISYPPPAS